MSSVTSTRNPLQVPELLHHILDCLVERNRLYRHNNPLARVRPPERDARRALAALARTCRAFSEPSLDYLWRKLDSLRPLFLCYTPADGIDEGGGNENLHPPSLAEWGIINRYSHRIQELIVSDGSSLHLLECSIFESNILPNLRILRWDVVFNPISLIQPLLSPKLVSLTFWPASNDKALSSFFKTIPSRCPALKEIQFRLYTELYTSVVSRAVCSFQRLECLAVRALVDGIALRHLLVSPQFTQLTLQIQQSQLNELSLLPSDIPFPRIKKLELFVPELGSTTSLLRSEGQMFSVVKFHVKIPTTCHFALSFFTMLASNPRQSSLQSVALIMDDSKTHPKPTQAELEVPRYTFFSHTLRPLRFLCSLYELRINLDNRICLDDEELADLACGWPLLRVFELGSMSGSSIKHLTFKGLQSLVIACPKLKEVTLSLDAREVPTTGADRKVSHAAVEVLTFPNSPISDPNLVAVYLLKHFPSIRHVQASRRDAVLSRDRNLPKSYSQEWSRVQRCLGG